MSTDDDDSGEPFGAEVIRQIRKARLDRAPLSTTLSSTVSGPAAAAD